MNARALHVGGQSAALHLTIADATGRFVLWLVDADDLGEAQDPGKRESTQHGTLGGEALTPIVGVEPPTDLDRGHDLRQKVGRSAVR